MGNERTSGDEDSHAGKVGTCVLHVMLVAAGGFISAQTMIHASTDGSHSGGMVLPSQWSCLLPHVLWQSAGGHNGGGSGRGGYIRHAFDLPMA
jgi:hypothetical protein